MVLRSTGSVFGDSFCGIEDALVFLGFALAMDFGLGCTSGISCDSLVGSIGDKRVSDLHKLQKPLGHDPAILHLGLKFSGNVEGLPRL